MLDTARRLVLDSTWVPPDSLCTVWQTVPAAGDDGRL
jgi:hypothetical protein